jgi:hypothetical protein
VRDPDWHLEKREPSAERYRAIFDDRDRFARGAQNIPCRLKPDAV